MKSLARVLELYEELCTELGGHELGASSLSIFSFDDGKKRGKIEFGESGYPQFVPKGKCGKSSQDPQE